VIESLKAPKTPHQFAPLFDAARGLFWDHTDVRLVLLAREGKAEVYIKKYATRSRPIFGTDGPTGILGRSFAVRPEG